MVQVFDLRLQGRVLSTWMCISRVMCFIGIDSGTCSELSTGPNVNLQIFVVPDDYFNATEKSTKPEESNEPEESKESEESQERAESQDRAILLEPQKSTCAARSVTGFTVLCCLVGVGALL